jgi:DNA-binding GntR family transcriptional regulator
VSRTPFREAIGTLAKGGLIEIKPYRGFYVRSFSRNETATYTSYTSSFNVLRSNSRYRT